MNEYKEVYYCAYCYKCKYFDSPDIDDPCNQCLTIPVNAYSHKPIKFTPKEECKNGRERSRHSSGR